MRPISRFSSRPAALAAVGAGAAALLLLARPLRGQQGPFAVQASVPATASGGPTTDVNYSFPLPPGFELQRNPRVRVVDAKGRLVELLPMYIDRRTPLWSGHRGLHTENYRPGTYSVDVEVDQVQPDGAKSTVATGLSPLSVPAR